MRRHKVKYDFITSIRVYLLQKKENHTTSYAEIIALRTSLQKSRKSGWKE